MAAFNWPLDGHVYSADEIGRAHAGLFRREANGVPRVGMLDAPVVTVVAASWKVQVGPFTYVHQVSGAVQLSGESSTVQVDITPATTIPAGQARIDRVCWSPESKELLVVSGIPAVVPVAPSAAGLASVAVVRVNAGDGMVVAGQVSADYVSTGLVMEGERRTVPLTLTGATGWNGVASWRDFQVINFEGVFDEAPGVEATGVFPAQGLQVMQITQVTKTGFQGRVIRFGHVTPVAGTLTYTAAV